MRSEGIRSFSVFGTSLSHMFISFRTKDHFIQYLLLDIVLALNTPTPHAPAATGSASPGAAANAACGYPSAQ